MDFRFQEPETDVEPVIYLVKAKLEGQVATLYVGHQHGRWNVSNSQSMSYVQAYAPMLEEALDKARELCCRNVKAQVLDAAARRIRQG